ncbi:MAG: hypothetical protein Q9181_006459 [Wetmoreana brouardii]
MSTGSPQPASSKKQLQATTRKLLMQGTPEHSRHLQDELDSVDPVKFSPPNAGPSDATTTAEDPYAEYARNPSHETTFTKIDDLLREYEKANSQTSPTAPRFLPTKYQHRPKGMSQSMSENNISFRRPYDHSHFSPNVIQQRMDYDTAGATSRYEGESPSFARSRGRRSSRAPSPVKALEDIKEDQTPEGIRDQSPHKDISMELPASPVKRSRSPMKQLFGDKGFLGRSTSMKELPSEEYRKKGMKHFGAKFKQRVGDMSEGVSKFIPASISHGDLSKFIPASLTNRESPSKSSTVVPTSTFPVSLSPPEQARFYADAELMICATANKYLITQKEEGRMSYESIAKVTSSWAQKNRPQVIDFMFDQLTQRDLILYNIKTFRFYGPNAENGVNMNAMLNCWKTLAKEMSVRTFCTGDSTIRKQIQDIYKILEMLGAPMVTFMAFQQIQVKVLKTMREQQQKRDENEAMQFGVERKWEPPGGFGPRDSAESEAYTNPFTDD